MRYDVSLCEIEKKTERFCVCVTIEAGYVRTEIKLE